MKLFRHSFVELVERQVPEAFNVVRGVRDMEDLTFTSDRAASTESLARLFALVLACAIKDNASQIRITAKDTTDGTVWYTVRSREYKMLPLPNFIGLPLVSKISAASGIASNSGQGKIILTTPNRKLYLGVHTVRGTRHTLIISGF